MIIPKTRRIQNFLYRFCIDDNVTVWMKPKLFRKYQKLLGTPLFGVIFYDGKLVSVTQP